MKNITVSIDDETYRRARMAAAANDTSVSAMVREMLISLTSNIAPESVEEAAERRLHAFLRKNARPSPGAERGEPTKKAKAAVPEENFGISTDDLLSRDELHDRSRR